MAAINNSVSKIHNMGGGHLFTEQEVADLVKIVIDNIGKKNINLDTIDTIHLGIKNNIHDTDIQYIKKPEVETEKPEVVTNLVVETKKPEVVTNLVVETKKPEVVTNLVVDAKKPEVAT